MLIHADEAQSLGLYQVQMMRTRYWSVSGHDFSRAEQHFFMRGSSPCGCGALVCAIVHAQSKGRHPERRTGSPTGLGCSLGGGGFPRVLTSAGCRSEGCGFFCGASLGSFRVPVTQSPDHQIFNRPMARLPDPASYANRLNRPPFPRCLVSSSSPRRFCSSTSVNFMPIPSPGCERHTTPFTLT
jgi:hypothetical protein